MGSLETKLDEITKTEYLQKYSTFLDSCEQLYVDLVRNHGDSDDEDIVSLKRLMEAIEERRSFLLFLEDVISNQIAISQKTENIEEVEGAVLSVLDDLKGFEEKLKTVNSFLLKKNAD